MGTERTDVRTAFGLASGASGTVYVDKSNVSGSENGTKAFPYDTVAEGESALSPGGQVVIKAADYSETLLLDTEGTYFSDGGATKVGE